MNFLVSIIVQAISGMVGGGIAGNLVKAAGMALLPKLLSGAIGGIAGGSILGALIGGAPVDPAAADVATRGLDIGNLIAQIGGGAVGGGIVTAIVSQMLKR